jgi:hypothetical protein
MFPTKHRGRTISLLTIVSSLFSASNLKHRSVLPSLTQRNESRMFHTVALATFFASAEQRLHFFALHEPPLCGFCIGREDLYTKGLGVDGPPPALLRPHALGFKRRGPVRASVRFGDTVRVGCGEGRVHAWASSFGTTRTVWGSRHRIGRDSSSQRGRRKGSSIPIAISVIPQIPEPPDTKRISPVI